jgi:hypothetical protein
MPIFVFFYSQENLTFSFIVLLNCFLGKMDEFFGGMDGRCRVSITDSTMMLIVHQAMDKAHEKVKSKEGIVERLNEMSKFYELAVMQLEGCLKFVQEETDSCLLESNHEEVLADLKEIRDRLQGRLNESELAISDKDRELTERVENEMKLRQALEVKEREVVALRADLEIERRKSEGIEEFEDRDGEFCELKNSVDQQVWNIKQKLGPDEERNRGIDNKKIEQMGLDIDMLKETLDLAFEKMQKAIFLSEMGPIEQQWRWSIEKDTICILIKGLMSTIQESDTLADVWEKIDKVSVSYAVNDQEEEPNEIIRMLKQEKEDANLQTMIIEETYVTLLKGLMKEFFIELYNYDLECLIREGIEKGFFRETIIQWNERFESNKIEAQIREEIYFIVFREALKDHDFESSDCQYIRDDHNNIIGDMLSANTTYNGPMVSGEENLTQIPDSRSQCFQEEEEEQTENLELAGLKSEEMEEQEMLIGEEHDLSSVSGKLEKALHQLVRSKELLGELGCSLGITVGDLEKFHAHVGGPSFLLPKDNEEGQLDASDSVFSPLPVLLQVLVNFERVVHQKLGMNILRYFTYS